MCKGFRTENVLIDVPCILNILPTVRLRLNPGQHSSAELGIVGTASDVLFKAGRVFFCFHQEVYATLLDARSPPPSLTVPVTLSGLCDLEKNPRLGSVVSPTLEDMACRQLHGTSLHLVLFFFPCTVYNAMTFFLISSLPSLFPLSICVHDMAMYAGR